MKIVHYINQFFAGIGGEDSANAGPELKEEPLGPGRKLNSLLGDEHQIVATVCCGDDYASSKEGAAKEILELIEGTGAEMLIAGPAFTSGRNGIACGRVAAAAAAAGLKALAAMHPDNPGVAEAGQAPVVPTGETAREMGAALEAIAEAVDKLASGEPIPNAIEGKAPRKNRMAKNNAATRAVELALKRLSGDSSATEIPLPDFGTVEPAPPVADPADALVALLTEGGLVPDGNPGRLESSRATKWLRYSLEGKESMASGEFQSIHGGFSTVAANADPNRILPLDVAREMEKEGRIGRLHAEYMVTVGNGMPIDSATGFGVEWAEELRKAGVQAAILTSTWGTGTRCGSTLAKELERAGIPTALLCNLVPIANRVGAPRIVPTKGIPYPAGDPNLSPEQEKAWRRQLLETALEAISTEVKKPTVFEPASA